MRGAEGVEWMKDLLRGELTLVDEGRLGFDLSDDLLLVHGREGHGRPGERTAHDV
jgi:predicted ThiF/HesA family dinucleotide-utilizing enzyme